MRVVVNGTGSRQVAVDDVVTVHAKGLEKHFGKSPGHVFYSTKNKHHGGPFTYKVGSNKLPLGWDVGCRGMRLGEKREFDIPWWEVRNNAHRFACLEVSVFVHVACPAIIHSTPCRWLTCTADRGGGKTESQTGVFGHMPKCSSRSRCLPFARKQKHGKRWMTASSDRATCLPFTSTQADFSF